MDFDISKSNIALIYIQNYVEKMTNEFSFKCLHYITFDFIVTKNIVNLMFWLLGR